MTTQTVRDHFGAKDDLLRALADALSEDLGTSRRAAPAASTAAAVGKLLDEYEDYGLAAAGLLVAAEHSEALAAMVARGREEHRAWLEEVFGDRLPSGADAPLHVRGASPRSTRRPTSARGGCSATTSGTRVR